MGTQSTADDSENPSAYAEILGTESLEELSEKPWNVKLALTRPHLELARIMVRELLEEEVEATAGERYSPDKPHGGRYSRWGTNPGSVRIGDEKVPIGAGRMVDNETGEAFIERSAKALEAFESRSLEDVDLTAMIVDARHVAGEQ